MISTAVASVICSISRPCNKSNTLRTLVKWNALKSKMLFFFPLNFARAFIGSINSRLQGLKFKPFDWNWDFPSRCSLKKSENLKQSPFTRNSPSIHLILYPLQVWFSYFSKIDFANFNLLLTDFTLPIPLSYLNKNAFGLECEYLLFHFTASYWVNIVSPKLWKWTECDTCKIFYSLKILKF